jgi:hypothetical protein
LKLSQQNNENKKICFLKGGRWVYNQSCLGKILLNLRTLMFSFSKKKGKKKMNAKIASHNKYAQRADMLYVGDPLRQTPLIMGTHQTSGDGCFMISNYASGNPCCMHVFHHKEGGELATSVLCKTKFSRPVNSAVEQEVEELKLLESYFKEGMAWYDRDMSDDDLREFLGKAEEECYIRRMNDQAWNGAGETKTNEGIHAMINGLPKIWYMYTLIKGKRREEIVIGEDVLELMAKISHFTGRPMMGAQGASAQIMEQRFERVRRELEQYKSDGGKSSAKKYRTLCSECKKEGSGKGLKICSACKQAAYCSVSCQKAHWPKHKTDCAKAKKKAAETKKEENAEEKS